MVYCMVYCIPPGLGAAPRCVAPVQHGGGLFRLHGLGHRAALDLDQGGVGFRHCNSDVTLPGTQPSAGRAELRLSSSPVNDGY